MFVVSIHDEMSKKFLAALACTLVWMECAQKWRWKKHRALTLENGKPKVSFHLLHFRFNRWEMRRHRFWRKIQLDIGVLLQNGLRESFFGDNFSCKDGREFQGIFFDSSLHGQFVFVTVQRTSACGFVATVWWTSRAKTFFQDWHSSMWTVRQSIVNIHQTKCFEMQSDCDSCILCSQCRRKSVHALNRDRNPSRSAWRSTFSLRFLFRKVSECGSSIRRVRLRCLLLLLIPWRGPWKQDWKFFWRNLQAHQRRRSRCCSLRSDQLAVVLRSFFTD
jgi:hypothetical protein